MSYTQKFTATQSAWLKVVDGPTHAFLQLQDSGPVYVVVAPGPPNSGSFDGVELDAKGLQEIAIDNMEANDAVYIRSRHDENNAVLVMAPGSPPA